MPKVTTPSGVSVGPQEAPQRARPLTALIAEGSHPFDGHHGDTVRTIHDEVSAFDALTAPQLKMRVLL